MKKGSKIALVILGVVSVVCVAGIWTKFNDTTKRLDEVMGRARTEGDEMIILLAGEWSYEAIELRTAPMLGTKEEVVLKMELWRDKLGTLVSSEGEITDSRYDLGGASGSIIYADYTAVCEFEKGSATIVLEMSIEPGNRWLLERFTVTPSDESGRQSSE